MATLQIDVQDDLINLFGTQAIKQFIEEELAYKKFRLLELELNKALSQASDVNWEQEFEIARQKAFEEYQKISKRKS